MIDHRSNEERRGGGQQMNKINEKRTYLEIGSDIDIYLTNDNSKTKNIKSNPSTSLSTLLRHGAYHHACPIITCSKL